MFISGLNNAILNFQKSSTFALDKCHAQSSTTINICAYAEQSPFANRVFHSYTNYHDHGNIFEFILDGVKL